jgi:HNH endonuclease
MPEWRSIPGWPDYEASSLGDIRRIGGQIRRPAVGKYGHLGLVLYSSVEKPKKQWVHRLVCAAFHGAPPFPGAQAAHWNGRPDDNKPENLRWATAIDNEADKKLHGTDNGGARNGMAVLAQSDVDNIRAIIPSLPRSSGGKRIKKGSLALIAKQYGVTASCVRLVISGATWNAPINQGKDHASD